MDVTKQEKLISRSKSTGCLDTLDDDYGFKCLAARFCGHSECGDRGGASVLSVEGGFASDGSDLTTDEANLDSGDKSSVDSEALFILEQKVDKLHELLQEQQSLLMAIKDNVAGSKASERQVTANKDVEEETNLSNETREHDSGAEGSAETSGAQSLLHAITVNEVPGTSLDDMIRVALENFLQNDEVCARMAAGAARGARGAARGELGRALAGAYLPLVQRSHRRLVQHATRLLHHGFAHLEERTRYLLRTTHKTSRHIRASLERHENLLEATKSSLNPLTNFNALRTTIKQILEDELKPWREKVLQEISSQILCDDSCEGDGQEPPFGEYSPSSPMQPANFETSPIDALMECAVITKLVRDGDVEGAFARALRSAELARVAAACRAAPPAWPLRAPLRLALLRQLAADMVHDTQLKCSYLEESIISLDKCDAATRGRLPPVVGEVRHHLTKFLLAYPKHHASRRIALIIMAADNLLK